MNRTKLHKQLMSDDLPSECHEVCENAAIEIDLLMLEVAQLRSEREVLVKHMCTAYNTTPKDVTKRVKEVVRGERDQYLLLSRVPFLPKQ